MNKYQKSINDAVKGMGTEQIAATLAGQLKKINDADEAAAYMNGLQDTLMLLTDDTKTVLEIFHGIERMAQE